MSRDPEYFKKYRSKIKADAIEVYGGKCSCTNCINNRQLKKSEQKILRIFLINKKSMNDTGQGQFGIFAHLRKLNYPKDAAMLLCRDCYLGKHMCDKQQYSDKHIELIGYFKKNMYRRRR